MTSDYHLGYYEGIRNATAMLIDLASQLRSEESARAFNDAIMVLAEERNRAKETLDQEVANEEEWQ